MEDESNGTEFICPKCGKQIVVDTVEDLPVFPGKWIGYAGCPSCHFMVTEHRLSSTKDEALKHVKHNLEAIMSVAEKSKKKRWVDNELMKKRGYACSKGG